MRIGYAPFSRDFSSPTDRFRFGSFLRSTEIVWEPARPEGDYDAVVLSLAADLSAWSRRPKSEMPIVFDIVDPYMFTGRKSPGDRLRALGKRATGDFKYTETSFRDVLDRMLARADAVVCGSRIQAEYVRQFCPHVSVILDDHSDTVREIKSDYSRGETLSLVWEGMLGNVVAFREVVPAVAAGVRFHVLTNLESPRYLRRYGKIRATDVVQDVFGAHAVSLCDWRIETFSRTFTSGDVALIPVPSGSEFYRAKSASKLLLAARHGLPILCSSTPAYEEFSQAAGVPMTCRTSDEWRDKLAMLADDEPLRREWGTRVRKYAEREFSSEALHRQWGDVLTSVGVHV